MRGYVSKVQILLYHESSKDCKSHLLQSAVTGCGLVDEFVPQEISQATSSLYFLTRLSMVETQESILVTQDSIRQSFENQELSLRF